MITHLGHAAIRIRELETSLAFYVGSLGLQEAFRLHHEDGSVWIVYLQINGNQFLELFPGAPEDDAGAVAPLGIQHLCLLVEDMDAALATLRARGYPIEGEPRTGKDGNRQFWLRDPDGTRIELMEIAPGSPQAQAGRRWEAAPA